MLNSENRQNNASFPKILLFCVAAFFLNIVFTRFFGWISGILFMDTVFPMALLFYFGLWPALFIQLAFNVLTSLLPAVITNNYNGIINMLYGLSGMAIIFVSWLFTRKSEKFEVSQVYTVLYLLLISFCAALASCIVAGIVNNFIFAVTNPSPENFKGYEKVFFTLFGNGAFSFLSLILGRIPVTIADRIITTFLGFGVFKLTLFIEKKISERNA